MDRSRFSRSISAKGRGEQYKKVRIGTALYFTRSLGGWRGGLQGKLEGFISWGKNSSGNLACRRKSQLLFLHDQPDRVLLVTSCSCETAMAAQLPWFT